VDTRFSGWIQDFKLLVSCSGELQIWSPDPCKVLCSDLHVFSFV
jgi:hypothetical protein